MSQTDSTPRHILQHELFDHLPPEWPDDLLPSIQAKLRQARRRLIVLDDDPTGTQTVHGVPVLTQWPVERLEEMLSGGWPAVYLLTNSRSLPLEEAKALNAKTGAALRQAGASTGQDFVVASRSDSTLRGHFPGEIKALADGLRQAFDAWLIVPCFPEGGRYTIDDVHYVADGDWLVPAGETEFARDKAFGYHSSNLRDWVVEKSSGTIHAVDVASISIDDLREGGPQAVTDKLMGMEKGAVCIINAVSYRDLEVLISGLLDAEAHGRRYLYRTAASFVRVRAGIAPRRLLTAKDLNLPNEGAGLIVAGSYVPKTTSQLEALLELPGIGSVEVAVEKLLDDTQRSKEITRCAAKVNEMLAQGSDTLLYTSRKLASTQGAESNLAIGRTVSESLVEIVRGLKSRPRYLLAKGGITSSDIATQGFGIQKAEVLGQILPGVPLWKTGPESRFPELIYIVFPGNVGDADALAKVVQTLQQES